MKLTSTVLSLATALIGVSADAHDRCWCVDALGVLLPDVTKQACYNYPQDRFYWDDDGERIREDMVVIAFNQDNQCQTATTNSLILIDNRPLGSDLDIAPTTACNAGRKAGHLGGKEFQELCDRFRPAGTVSNSVCDDDTGYKWGY